MVRLNRFYKMDRFEHDPKIHKMTKLKNQQVPIFEIHRNLLQENLAGVSQQKVAPNHFPRPSSPNKKYSATEHGPGITPDEDKQYLSVSCVLFDLVDPVDGNEGCARGSTTQVVPPPP